jgi:hypothetical protein
MRQYQHPIVAESVAPPGPILDIVESSITKHPFTKNTTLWECRLCCLYGDIGHAQRIPVSCSQTYHVPFTTLHNSDSASTLPESPMIVRSEEPPPIISYQAHLVLN